MFLVLFSCSYKTEKTTDGESGATKKSSVHYSEEKHFKNIRQLTYGGDNAEAYFSFDDSKLVFQLKNPEVGVECDQIYVLDYINHDIKKYHIIEYIFDNIIEVDMKNEEELTEFQSFLEYLRSDSQILIDSSLVKTFVLKDRIQI